MPKIEFTPEALRARFAELQPIDQALLAEMAPLQEEQAEIANYKREREVELNGELKILNARRAEVNNEMAMISRALAGKTSEPSDTETVVEEDKGKKTKE